jgi:hypothetical protein
MRRIDLLLSSMFFLWLAGCGSGGPSGGGTGGSAGGAGGMNSGAGGMNGGAGGSGAAGMNGGAGGSGAGGMNSGAGGSGAGGTSGGTGGSGGVCEAVVPCGGEIVPGTYRITSFCADGDQGSDPSCPGASTSTNSLTFGGTYVFSADQSYTFVTTGSQSETLRVPVSCLTEGGYSMTCLDLQQEMRYPSSDEPTFSPYTSLTCTGSTVCSCVATMDLSSSETGEYSFEGSLLTTSPNDGGPVQNSPYCVSGNQIILGPAQCDTTCSSGTSGTSRMVLTRQ